MFDRRRAVFNLRAFVVKTMVIGQVCIMQGPQRRAIRFLRIFFRQIFLENLCQSHERKKD